MESKTKEQIAVENVQAKFPKMLVREYCGYIIIAFDELDYRCKIKNITNGEIRGFYTVESAQVLQPWSENKQLTFMEFIGKEGCLSLMVIPFIMVMIIFYLIFRQYGNN